MMDNCFLWCVCKGRLTVCPSLLGQLIQQHLQDALTVLSTNTKVWGPALGRERDFAGLDGWHGA